MTLQLIIDINLSPEWVPFQLRGPRVLPEQIGGPLLASLRRFRADLEAGALVVIEPGRSRVRVLPL